MQGKRTHRRILSIVALVTLVISVGTASAQPSVVFRRDANPFDKPFEQWTAEWWQFILSLPAAVNPLLDTGEQCAVGQHGPVWFLAGSLGEVVTRTCTVPSGKALFVPVLNLVDINGTTQTARELRAEIAPCMDAVAGLSLEVDGQRVRNLAEDFHIRSAVFDITVPPGGLLPPGTYSPVVDDGFYVMLKPLSVGSHTIHLSGASEGCPIQGPFSVDVFYHLNIVPVSLK